jgi:AraC-like DNA-binding protein
MKPKYKPVQDYESDLLSVVYQENRKMFDYPWHYHYEYELTYIPNGQGIRYVGNSIENFFNNDLVLIGSMVPHCWMYEPGQDKQAPNAVVIYLKGNFFDKEWIRSFEFEGIRNLLKLSEKGIKFGQAITLELKQQLIDLVKLTPIQKFISLIKILQELSASSDYRLLCEQKFSTDLDQGNSDRINIVCKYIDEHYQEKISLAAVADQVHMSPEYFSRFFSKTMKKSFFEFLNEYKISKSCKLLIETDKSITEICYNSGFESVPFFYRQFKKFKNCQPKQYRLNYAKAFS